MYTDKKFTTRQSYKLAYRITRLTFKHDPLPTPDAFFGAWMFWSIPVSVGIAALKSFDYSLDK